MTDDHIESPRNPRVKAVVRLRTRAERDRTGLFLIEGDVEVSRALEAGVTGQALYVAGSGGRIGAVVEVARAAGVPVHDVAEAAFRRMAYRDATSGVILVAEQFSTNLDGIELAEKPLLLVVEAIEKPGNLGTMLRTAEGAGVDGIIVCDPTTDVFNPNVVRASLGTIFWVPLAVSSSAAAIDWLRARRIQIVAATPDAATAYFAVDLTGPTALVIGTEHAGLSDVWLEHSDQSAFIPMQGQGDSLNAAVSAALVVYEAIRQRVG